MYILVFLLAQSTKKYVLSYKNVNVFFLEYIKFFVSQLKSHISCCEAAER